MPDTTVHGTDDMRTIAANVRRNATAPRPEDIRTGTQATAQDITSQLSCELDGTSVGCWKRAAADQPAPRIRISRATWDGPLLILEMDNGQRFKAIFAEADR